MDDFDDYDWCYECTGNGDDFYINEGGELVCACDGCPFSYLYDIEKLTTGRQ